MKGRGKGIEKGNGRKWEDIFCGFVGEGMNGMKGGRNGEEDIVGKDSLETLESLQ